MTRHSFVKHTAGFTLAELLIVVAIILVLVAIAVPVFTGATARAQEATCAGNRHTVKVIVSDSYMLDTSLTVDSQYIQDVAAKLEAQNNGNKLCPSGGTYSFKGNASNGVIIIQCSKHGISADDEMYSNVLGSLGGDWWATGSAGVKGDTGAREKYATEHGLSEWPKITGTDGTSSFYLQFKSYNNSSSGSFLYAGYESKIVGGGNQWNAKYVCDNKGVAGPAGQWYEVADKSNLTLVKNENDMSGLLKSGTPVNLTDNKFVAG